MKTSLALGVVVVVLGVVAGCGKKEEPPVPQVGTNAAPAGKYSSGNPVTAPVDYLGAVVQAQKSAVKKIDVAAVTKAIQQFEAMEGRRPKDLQELVKEHYLGVVPAVPHGMKLVYNAENGDVKVVPE